MERSLALAALLLLMGCGSGSGTSEPVAATRLVDISITSPVNLSVQFVDQAITLTASLTENGNALDLPVEWQSDLDGSLTVTNNLAFLSPGVHQISASVSAEGVIQTKRVTIAVVSQSDVIEALILGTGDLATPATESPSCPRDQEWGTWRSGSNISIKVPSTFSSVQVDQALDFADVVNEISNNNIFLSVDQVETTADEYVPGEVNMVYIAEDAEDCNGVRSCANHSFDPDKAIESAVVKIREGSDLDVISHELGHAILGLCHIDATKMVGDTSIMSSPKGVYGATRPLLPTDLDVFAFQSVFFSDALPGATHQDLVALGVLEP